MRGRPGRARITSARPARSAATTRRSSGYASLPCDNGPSKERIRKNERVGLRGESKQKGVFRNRDPCPVYLDGCPVYLEHHRVPLLAPWVRLRLVSPSCLTRILTVVARRTRMLRSTRFMPSGVPEAARRGRALVEPTPREDGLAPIVQLHGFFALSRLDDITAVHALFVCRDALQAEPPLLFVPSSYSFVRGNPICELLRALSTFAHPCVCF